MEETKQLNGTNLAEEKATRHDCSSDAIPTPCGAKGTSERASFVTLLASKLRGNGCARVHECYNHRGGVFGLNNRNGNPPTLTLPLRWGGNLDENSDTLQSLINSKHFTHLTHLKKAAFTLAEVLITLGVIGIVAAMTIPNLVQSYKKKVVETKLLQTYSILSQAIKLSEVDNGSVSTWGGTAEIRNPDGSSDIVANQEYAYNFVLKYLAPYVKYTQFEKNSTDEDGNSKGASYMVLNNGTKLKFWHGSLIDITADINGDSSPNITGIDCFNFIINTTNSPIADYGLSTYLKTPDTIDDALTKCKSHAKYCSTLIKMNGWKIPDNYPYRF